MLIKDIKKIKLLEADKLYRDTGITFIVRDGKLKGLGR